MRPQSVPETRQFERLLGLLGVSRTQASLRNLTELVGAYLSRVPFENISKLYYGLYPNFCSLRGLSTFLDGLEYNNLGGTCYPNNYYLNLLLEYLGYDVSLCGADMDKPDVHLVSIVKLGNREYLIDAGYGAPFYAPLPRDIPADHVISHGREKYILKPRDTDNNSRLEHYHDGDLIHGYTVKPIPRSIEYFREVITDSFDGRAMFMNNVRLERFSRGRSIGIRNLTLTETSSSETKVTRLTDRVELIELAVSRFNIPREIVAPAVSKVILD